MEPYGFAISRTLNDLGAILFHRRVIPNHSVFDGEGAQKGAQFFGAQGCAFWSQDWRMLPVMAANAPRTK
jgi:hypothetical protein